MGGLVKSLFSAVTSVLGGDRSIPQQAQQTAAVTSPLAAPISAPSAAPKPKQTGATHPRLRGGRAATILTTSIDDGKLGG